MELSKQVCSLELAKRLKELGVKQESIIHWQFFAGWGEHEDHWELRHYSDFKQSTADPERELCAFTVAELGEMLGKEANAVMFAENEWAALGIEAVYDATVRDEDPAQDEDGDGRGRRRQPGAGAASRPPGARCSRTGPTAFPAAGSASGARPRESANDSRASGAFGA
jgi:hypothetical protein